MGSLGLTAYRALVRRSASSPYVCTQPRPSGELLWIHSPAGSDIHAVIALAKRMQHHRHGIHILITTHTPCPAAAPSIFMEAPPGEHPREVQAFLDHWRPNIGLWLWGELMPNLLLNTHSRKIPLFMADADQSGFENRRDRWLPEVARTVLRCFEKILTRSENDFSRIHKILRRYEPLETSGTLQTGGQTLTYSESDFSDISAQIDGRPLWLATQVQPAEVPTILHAHRHAMRMSHRLILVLNPASESHDAQFRALLKDEGIRFASWEDGDPIEDPTQVLLASAQDEMGLWYRLAPLAFLGSSLIASDQDLDPFLPAAHGCSILYGPNIGQYAGNYTRLAAAGAARIINDAETLGVAVARLISPDQAASMAMAGWDVVSEGAVITDRIIELINSALDAHEAEDNDART